jgi:hypothetical protein
MAEKIATMKKLAAFVFAFLLIAFHANAQFGLSAEARDSIRKLTETDYNNMLSQLHIDSERPVANGNDPNAPNAANYDDAKANPYPDLPDPLTLNNGEKVINAKTWWNKRRPQITEDFDREIYGRVHANTPKVNWEIAKDTIEMNGNVQVHTKKLIGHADNSSYPSVSVNIGLSLSTPVNAKGPVPVQHNGGHTPVPNWPAFIEFASRYFNTTNAKINL